jgi:hypothetical protein
MRAPRRRAREVWSPPSPPGRRAARMARVQVAGSLLLLAGLVVVVLAALL